MAPTSMNINSGPTSVLGKRKNTNSNSNSNNNQAKTYKKREVNLPKLQIGTGMGCPIAGMPRYMKRAQKTLTIILQRINMVSPKVSIPL